MLGPRDRHQPRGPAGTRLLFSEPYRTGILKLNCAPGGAAAGIDWLLIYPAIQRIKRPLCTGTARVRREGLRVGLYPIVTLQYSSTTLYQVSDHIQSLLF